MAVRWTTTFAGIGSAGGAPVEAEGRDGYSGIVAQPDSASRQSVSERMGGTKSHSGGGRDTGVPILSFPGRVVGPSWQGERASDSARAWQSAAAPRVWVLAGSDKEPGMTSNKMPTWLVVLLTLLGVVFLGPPALVLLAVAVGVVLKASVIALKLGVVVLVIAAAVALVRAVFGSRPVRSPAQPRVESIEDMAERLAADERRQREALDRQLAEALNGSR